MTEKGEEGVRNVGGGVWGTYDSAVGDLVELDVGVGFLCGFDLE